jgi:DNA-binding transcriptional LysR family regulator
MKGTIADLDAVLAFTRVAQLRSFSAAAQKLGLPKSTVSRRVAGLERRLGAQLLHRTTRKLALTDIGELYFARCERVIGELEEAERAVHELQAVPRGVLRVTTPADFGFDAPARLIAAFQLAYPEVHTLVVATNERLDLVAGGFDVALRASRSLPDSSLVARKLLSMHHALYASPDYLERRGTPERPEQLAQHDCIIFGRDRLQTSWRLQGPEGEIEVDVTGRFGCNDFNFARGAAIGGSGIALLPAFGCRGGELQHQLVRVLPDYVGEDGSLYAVYPTQRHLTPKVRAFVDFAAEHIGRWLPGSGPRTNDV